jgi:hypothetical protein
VLWIRNLKVFFFPDPQPALTLILNPDPVCLCEIHLNCRSSKHCKKADFFKSVPTSTFLDQDCLRKIPMNCRSSKHCKKS